MQKLAVVSHRPTVREHVEVPKKNCGRYGPRPLRWGMDNPLETRSSPRDTIHRIWLLGQTIGTLEPRPLR